MKFFTLALLPLLLCAPAYAADVDGKWGGTIESPTGDFPVAFTFKADGAKLAASRAAVERLHPGHGKDLHSPIYVAWQKIPYHQGGWITGADEYFNSPYKVFLEPDQRIYFAGDYCSHLLTWQEGAALSAHRTIKMISEHIRSAKA